MLLLKIVVECCLVNVILVSDIADCGWKINGLHYFSFNYMSQYSMHGNLGKMVPNFLGL